MLDVARPGLLRWVHWGDLHMPIDQEGHFRDLPEVIDPFLPAVAAICKMLRGRMGGAALMVGGIALIAR
jgi:hypothetical protein